MLAFNPNDRAVRSAKLLIDDPDATMRTAAIWAIANAEDTFERLLLENIAELLEDREQVYGAPLDEPYELNPEPVLPVMCCADAVYRLVEDRPELLSQALATS